MFTTIELNQAIRLDEINYKLVPFHHTHLNFMKFRESENQLFKSFEDYPERIKKRTCRRFVIFWVSSRRDRMLFRNHSNLGGCL